VHRRFGPRAPRPLELTLETFQGGLLMTTNRSGRATRALLALLLVLGAVTAYAQQPLFYQEVEKDGRIYVFADAKAFTLFSQSGETGKALSRFNYGPNGETMIFDSEQAIGLYNFKHGKPGEAFAEVKKPKADVSYKDGQLTAEFDKASVTFTNRLQLRMTDQMADSTVQLAGTAAKGDSKPSFRIRRYEPQFQGWLYTKKLTYKFEFAFQDLQNNTVAGGAVNDAYFNFDFQGQKQFRVQFGQFKVPFGRQELTSSFNLQMVDRSITAGEFEKGRDLGVQLDGVMGGTKLAWAVGAFNGNGRSVTLNDNDKFQYDARVTLQPFGGDVRLSEADFESTDKPLFAIAGQFESQDLGLSVPAPVAPLPPLSPIAACPCGAGNYKRTVLGGDVVFKYKGLFVMGEYFNRKIKPSGGAPTGSASFKSNGYDWEAGYNFGKSRKWQAAFRYAAFDPTDAKSDNSRTELGGGINWFYNKHFAKIQTDFRQLEDKAKKTKDKEFRIQTQLYF
jgi:hypothetical protein